QVPGCDASNCPTGCCDPRLLCTTIGPSSCGSPGGLCDDCSSLYGTRVDGCQGNSCGCAAAGGMICPNGQSCKPTGCVMDMTVCEFPPCNACDATSCSSGCCSNDMCKTRTVSNCGVSGGTCTD